ncbi:tRNA pseudouridine32 synthase / 23S rRNA pseudouridine746 synthase [Chitinophaga dinghuensis]|uniref:tRNA pseudouridine32 synthase / 23S rRNA pseudouridine746 synthase n=1 Tax=Chitinophaga dinghuensis TaxID=1539050 RepID=A0A327VU32_9BACT|nr:pseudouridylate synthase [Chitinophaga dinghuensis]RAJ78992.1 tRNA pseudouridine32 synthase / 23S rRNA pseudouridine746 synthase [Chitinophaga dinghuensis]
MITEEAECQHIITNKAQADAAFCRFNDQQVAHAMATGLTLNLQDNTHPLCEIAAAELQEHLSLQQEWQHNFGLGSQGTGAVIGKMFGVLVVRNNAGEIGYLCAFSGKLANGNHHSKFVAPIFDGLQVGGFVNVGMLHLSAINQEIAMLAQTDAIGNASAIEHLKHLRKTHSNALQRRILEQYNFRNKAGVFKNMVEIFTEYGYKQPPAGAGECAGPKLLQYAFQHQMEPLALAEFWWGLSPKSDTWKHGAYYKPCQEKCAPILAFMLS